MKEDPDTLFNMQLKSSLPTPSTADEQSKEIESLRKERDNLIDETKGLKVSHVAVLLFHQAFKASYSSLFKSYEKLRSNYELLHSTRNALAETAEKQRHAMATIYENALSLKSIMLEQAAK